MCHCKAVCQLIYLGRLPIDFEMDNDFQSDQLQLESNWTREFNNDLPPVLPPKPQASNRSPNSRQDKGTPPPPLPPKT